MIGTNESHSSYNYSSLRNDLDSYRSSCYQEVANNLHVLGIYNDTYKNTPASCIRTVQEISICLFSLGISFHFQELSLHNSRISPGRFGKISHSEMSVFKM
mgnify:CR=1 FL=1